MQTFIGDTYQVYPTSRTDKYPTLSDIRRFIHSSGLTEVKLEDEHVKSLLDVLVWDGKVEALPGSGLGGWEEESEEDERSRSKDKRKKRKRMASDEDESEEEDRRRKKKRSKRHSRSDEEDDEDDSQSDDDKHHRRSSSNGKKRKRSRSLSSEPDSGADSDDSRRRSRKKRRASRSPSLRSVSPITFRDASPSVGSLSGSVYRALRRETYFSGLTEVPCGLCEVYDFCAPGGPVNAKECEYYDEWLLPERVNALVRRREVNGKTGKGKEVEAGGEEVVEGEEDGEGEGTWDEGEEGGEGGEGAGLEIGYEEETFEEYD